MKLSRIWFWIVVLILVIAGLSRLRFDVEVLNLLPPEVPAVQGLRIYQEHFANARELIVTVNAPDAATAESAAAAIAESLRPATHLVASATWQPPWIEFPGESAELLAFLWLNQPPEVFNDLTNRLAPDRIAATLVSTRERLALSMSPGDIAQLSYDPFELTRLPDETAGAAPSFGEGHELFSSNDGTFRIVFVQPAVNPANYRAAKDWLAEVRRIVESARANNRIPPAVEIGYTGGPAFVAEISSGMEGDLKVSVGCTIAIIVALFWWAHRRFRPLLWLLTLLGCVLVGTLAIGGLLFGTVNVVSIGFAAILLGLSVDYALVLYQEALHMPEVTARNVRRALAPGIIWSAATTAGAFAILNFGGLPGLAQLGSMVAIGVLLAATVMLRFFLPPLMSGISSLPARSPVPAVPQKTIQSTGWTLTIIAGAAAILVLVNKRPALDRTTDSLRPKSSPAYTAMEQIKTNIARKQEPAWLLTSGTSESEVASRLAKIKPVLEHAVESGALERFNLPNPLWPAPESQAENRRTAGWLAAQTNVIRDASLAHGFTETSLGLTRAILETWRRAESHDGVFWPTNFVSRWVLEKATARDSSGFYALGLIYFPTNTTGSNASVEWMADLPREGVRVAGWDRLGSDLLDVIRKDLWRVMMPIVVLLIFTLWLAFRSVRNVLLSLATLAFSGMLLWAVMALAGWSWNLLNMLAMPLLLGAGVDYSIHMQLALARHRGMISETRRTLGRALLLCAGSTVAGFGSNTFSSNAGLESLGLVCATGIACTFLVSYFMLPVWWTAFAPRAGSPGTATGLNPPTPENDRSRLSAPSSLYRSEFWLLGLWLVRIIPRRICLAIGFVLAEVYWRTAADRRETMIQNLLPPLRDDREAATRQARKLLHQFVIKVVDLWRYEAGLPIQNSFGNATGWEHFADALEQKRGVLLLTPHLGNWEFGGPWLTQKGVPLLVVTLAEPGEKFTQLRQGSRSRWNIETLVIGTDPFAFIEIIRRLEAGATVALLVDRPAASTAITVQLFGRPFSASIAAAELARASGCILLPVYLPREGDTYAAHVLPQIPYERASLRDPAARRELTQAIISAFEPAIEKHLDQWYHFVPVWPGQNIESNRKPRSPTAR